MQQIDQPSSVEQQLDPTSQTLVGEAQSRLLEQQQQQQPPQIVSSPPDISSQQQQQTGRVGGGGIYEPSSTTAEVVRTSPEELANRPREEPRRPSDVRYQATGQQQFRVPGGVREEVVGVAEPKYKKIHIVEQRPGEAIYIKQQPSYFYQTQFYPGVRRDQQQTIRDPTIDYFNSLVAKNTHCLLGRTGVKVSRVCLGTMNFGQIDPTFGERPGQLDESEAHRILDRYVELGGNCIDTANFFPWFGTCGESERIVGAWLERQQREKIFVVTKVRMPVDPGNINSGGLSRANIIDSVKQSLKRLRTDYIDMLMLNGWDPTVSINETVRHLDELVKHGFVRYIGVCDFKGWQLQKFVDASRFYLFTCF